LDEEGGKGFGVVQEEGEKAEKKEEGRETRKMETAKNGEEVERGKSRGAIAAAVEAIFSWMNLGCDKESGIMVRTMCRGQS
jgi:hypothetical protein